MSDPDASPTSGANWYESGVPLGVISESSSVVVDPRVGAFGVANSAVTFVAVELCHKNILYQRHQFGNADRRRRYDGFEITAAFGKHFSTGFIQTHTHIDSHRRTIARWHACTHARDCACTFARSLRSLSLSLAHAT